MSKYCLNLIVPFFHFEPILLTFGRLLIEPDLYFDYAPDAKKRYIEAIEFVVGVV
jgi:hypothetical protein